MTDSRGGLSVPGTLVPKQCHIRIRRGEGEKAGPAKFLPRGLLCIINNVVEAEAPAQKVVEERAA
jgi:hypothetical protein